MVRLLSCAAFARTGLIVVAGLFTAFPAAAGDPAHGRSVFAAQCSVCHSTARNGPAIVGPSLFGVVGRPAASVAGFAYSSGMKASGITWSDERLRTYLPAPRQAVPSTKMAYGGVKNPAQLEDLIAYLDTLK
jgi:cytochrome c